jgi:hypothetical protein
MLLWHATPWHSLPSIRETGLDPDYATGRLRAVWLHSPAISSLVVSGVALRHGVGMDGVCLIAVRVRRRSIRRFRRCLWYACDVIPPRDLLIPRLGLASQQIQSRSLDDFTW